MNKQIIIGVIAGIVTGLPQSMGSGSIASTSDIPDQTILIIVAFGLAGGVWMSIALLKERIKQQYFFSKYIDLYTYILVSSLCIGPPIFIQYIDSANWQSNIFFSAYFFTSVCIGMFSGGIVKNVHKTT